MPCRVEHENALLELEGPERTDVIGEPYGVGWDGGRASNPRLDRQEIIFAFELEPIPAQVHERDGARSRVRCFFQKLTQCPAQRFLIEVARAGDIESSRLQGLRDQSGIIHGSVQRAGLVRSIADNECNALLDGLGLRSGRQCER